MRRVIRSDRTLSGAKGQGVEGPAVVFVFAFVFPAEGGEGFNPRTNPSKEFENRVRGASRVHALVTSRTLQIFRLRNTDPTSARALAEITGQ